MIVVIKNIDIPVITMEIDIENKLIKSLKIHEGQEKLVRAVFPKANDNASYCDFEKIFKFYLNDTTEIKLSDYLLAIQNKVMLFKTRHKHSLRIEVE